MKKIALLITVVVILALASFLAYEKWYKQESVNLWDNIPDNAVLVFESGNTMKLWGELVSSDAWESLGAMESMSQLNNDLKFLDSVVSDKEDISNLFQKNSLISLHVTERNNFDFVFHVDLNVNQNQKIASKLLEYFREDKNISFNERTYQGMTLSELNYEGGTFTYLLHQNLLVGSFTPFLVEDVVRLINSGNDKQFRASNASLFDMPKLANDDGNIYVNIHQASQWFSSFMNADAREFIKALKYFGEASFFDADMGKSKLLMNGFTVGDDAQFISTFDQQLPVKSDMKYYVPNRASVVYQFGLSDASLWHKRLINYWKGADQQFLQDRVKFEDKYSFSFDEFFLWIGTEVGLIALENNRVGQDEKLLFIKAKDRNEGLNQLNLFAESLSKAKGDSVYSENFSTYQIRELGVERFPEIALGTLYTGFDECYFTLINDYIVFGNSMQVVKSLVEDMESENTWGRSVVFNKYLESNLEEFNVSVTFNTRRLWESLTKQLDPKWSEFTKKSSSQLKSFNLGSIQFSRLDENYYTSLAIQYDKNVTTPQQRDYESVRTASVNSKLITKPFVVKNHVSGSLEVVSQDSAYNLLLISAEGSVLWSDSLGEPLLSEVQQVDYYKNGKLQYFFATPSALHIVDRLGNSVENFPVEIDGKIKFASVVDYDKSRRYRFFVGDERGNLYLFNKEGVSLEGWSPKSISGKLASQPFHLRIRGKDCMVAIQQDGIVNVMTRRGEMMPGFPLELDIRIDTQPFINIGSDFSKTVLTVLGKEGRLVNFNLTGKIISTEQLYKPMTETRFELVPDALGKNFVIARQDAARLVLLSPENEEILSKDYLSSEKLDVQYYDFGTDQKIYAVTDKTQGFTYIYDREGTLVNSRPFDSENEIALMYFEATKKYHIYTISGDTFKVITF